AQKRRFESVMIPPQQQRQQQASAHAHVPASVSFEVATAATRYQLLRELEAEHLAIMARQNLLAEWTPEVRAIVLTARAHVSDARDARAHFREQVRNFVLAFRTARELLPQVLRHTRALLQSLERVGAIRDDDGWFEAEVLEW